ncbi:uncharacterized protein LOC110827905 [Zootermopsis nevadensis]|uniref:Uncharacterized protein n=1 Tax=Zootermopsis nevadensis TaxID=136037 RepID=A0A067RP96_ZOONE|nr:uncharacterized protein LOC110827905 [Zootermopsis nevadensis]XP_021915746.1 uncharacterized protein LOC110827905 [Zootermopsis nevadensis]XP_021915747.1 uncharacterized protein LOC110827905 [Zootermopsis nevadensis]KDR21564.1 hypothetical protein L798_01718 [Zootermopsis nevadensis]
MKGVILWSILVTAVIATENENGIQDTEKKGPGFYYHYDLAVLAAILIIKFKAVLIALAVIFGIGAYSKLFAGHGIHYKGLKCQPPVVYEPPPKYDYEHESYGHSERRDRANDFTRYSENIDFELLTSVMKGIGLEELSFNVADKRSVPCRRRLVCEADRLASTKPVVRYAIDLLRGLSRYRTIRPTNQTDYSCAALYPRCISSRGSQRHLLKKSQKSSGLNLQFRRQ